MRAKRCGHPVEPSQTAMKPDGQLQLPPDSTSGDADALIPPLIRDLTAVVAAVFDLTGCCREGNRGFAYLLDRDDPPAVGEQVGQWFAQPDFQHLLAVTDPATGNDVYEGNLSLGDADRFLRTIRGRVQRKGDYLLLLGEHDVADLERLAASVLQLNEDLAQTHRDLVRANRQLHRDKAEIRRLMLTDPLTGAANRRRFAECCRDEIEEASETSGYRLALIAADLDFFKKVNDSFGHDVGDRALIAFTEAMRAKTRDDDLVVRLGGEEFCVLLPKTGLAEAGQVAERIRVQFADTDIDGVDGRLSASFGVVSWQAGWDIDDLLRAADQALYRAKRGGRNRVEIADDPGETKV